jgi:hypothetical protein
MIWRVSESMKKCPVHSTCFESNCNELSNLDTICGNSPSTRRRHKKIASGPEQGWPLGMLSPVIATKFHGMGITNVSTVCQDALSMGQEQFELKY